MGGWGVVSAITGSAVTGGRPRGELTAGAHGRGGAAAARAEGAAAAGARAGVQCTRRLPLSPSAERQGALPPSPPPPHHPPPSLGWRVGHRRPGWGWWKFSVVGMLCEQPGGGMLAGMRTQRKGGREHGQAGGDTGCGPGAGRAVRRAMRSSTRGARGAGPPQGAVGGMRWVGRGVRRRGDRARWRSLSSRSWRAASVSTSTRACADEAGGAERRGARRGWLGCPFCRGWSGSLAGCLVLRRVG